MKAAAAEARGIEMKRIIKYRIAHKSAYGALMKLRRAQRHAKSKPRRRQRHCNIGAETAAAHIFARSGK